MPHIVIHLSGQPNVNQSRRVVDKIMALTQSALGKQPGVIAITCSTSRPKPGSLADGRCRTLATMRFTWTSA